ncbi:DNA polymerase IV [Balneolaceae bacterium ANBcel3]|nr:DNA polymerase IV [Balneolaceae bacterium ANBcel3]
MKPSQSTPYDTEQDVHRITLYSSVARAHQHVSLKPRLYLHIDMNCFYAQVEQRAYNLYGLPVAMGGWRKPDGTPRGIVATASYEARQLGIKTAMSALEAHQRCPYLIFLQIDYEKYKGISRQLRSILDDFAPEVEKYSMDEYFLDISFLQQQSRQAISDMVVRLKKAIYDELGLVCSVGVAHSKTYSKLASGLHKPDGMLLLLDEQESRETLRSLPLDKIWGIGNRRYRRLQRHNILTIHDAWQRGPEVFVRIFGPMQGRLFYEMITGQDRAKVLDNDHHIPDEVSYMHTFSDWTRDIGEMHAELAKAVRQVCYRMRGYHRKARRFGCYIRYQDVEWKGTSFAFATPGYTNLDEYVMAACSPTALSLLQKAQHAGQRFRGIGLHTIEMVPGNQLDLFFTEDDRLSRLYRSVDAINNTYGKQTVLKGTYKHEVPGKTHFVSRS